MKSIVVTISPEGEVVIESVGYKGSACSLATKALEKALGISSKDTKKKEYHESDQALQRQGSTGF